MHLAVYRQTVYPVRMSAPDLTGHRFGKLTVVSRAENKWGAARFTCQCDCGQEHTTYARYLRNGKTRSCGCSHTKHGAARRGRATPEYKVWVWMRARCANPNNKSYPDYGGRGIKVCKRWRDSFEAFLEDMGQRPSSEHSIDRINNSKGYTPSNCRWATRAEQNRNSRRCKNITHDGRTMTVAEWSRELGIPGPTIYGRIYLGWPEERLLT